MASGLPMEDDWLRRIGPAHFSHINFRGTFWFNLEKYGHLLFERRWRSSSASTGDLTKPLFAVVTWLGQNPGEQLPKFLNDGKPPRAATLPRKKS